MSNQIPPSSGSGNIFAAMGDEIRLVLRLMKDPRINPLLKLIPIGTVLYFVIPIDLFVGPIDDAVVMGLGLYLFIELCPPEVVAEHRRAIQNSVNGDTPSADVPADQLPFDEEQIIEGEFREE